MRHRFVLHRFLPLIGAAAGAAAVAPAAAEWRCDCTTIVDSCTAEVSIEESWVEVATDQAQCARVDYFIDGMPFVAVVVEGRERQDWITRSADPEVLVQGCQVCRDNARTAEPADAGRSSPDAQAGLEPLIRVEPAYPRQAAERGLEGFVEVAFDVTEHGTVENAEVTASEPDGAFDAAALAAIARWRYPAEPGRGTASLSERLRFAPPAAPAPPPRAETPAAAERRSAAAPRSECIREDAVYNYGDRVEVDLINACGEPLALFACAQGGDAEAGRWECSGTHERRRILVGANDERVGTSAPAPQDEAAEPYRYADSFLLARTPNTEYWWVACAMSNDTCQSRARSWARALDGQPASVDPQARSSLRVSRSY